ncbi:MAG TPA: nucleoside recognition domain-containing protein [Burkholderiales bacterium]
MTPPPALFAAPLPSRLFRGERRFRIALLGLPGAGTTTLFNAVASGQHAPGECDLDIGLDQARVVEVPSLSADLGAFDAIIQVVDATALASHLELTRRLLELDRPVILALNKMDAARNAGLHIGTKVLAGLVGAAVIPTIATMGYGLRELFAAAAHEMRAAMQSGRSYRAPIHESNEALARIATRPGGVHRTQDWRYWLDELFLSRRFGLIGSAAVFAAVLFVVFDLSVSIDALTTAPLAAWLATWTPQTTTEVVLRAVADGLVGLLGIVVPYMIPLVLLLVTLEQVGIMARIAFAVDRVFHRFGLHGNVALPLLLGLGCNVPAISAIGASSRGNERLIACLLVTFVPCSARSAIILALAGKYLGAWGVLAVFLVAAIVIGVLGRLLQKRLPEGMAGHIQEIPPYAAPRWLPLLRETWLRTKDILTIVTPLLVGGSVVLALLSHIGAASLINTALSPITSLWLGLPAALGVPLLFGVLRKELSLVMVYQALGGPDVGAYMNDIQIFTFLIFLTLYVPCLSTFAVLLKTIGMRRALVSVSLSVGVALAVSGVTRFALLLA